MNDRTQKICACLTCGGIAAVEWSLSAEMLGRVERVEVFDRINRIE